MNPLATALLLAAGLAVFAWTMERRVGVLLGLKSDVRWDRPIERTRALLKYGFGQVRLLMEKRAGIMHVLIFAGFMVVGLRTITMFGVGISETFHLPLL